MKTISEYIQKKKIQNTEYSFFVNSSIYSTCDITAYQWAWLGKRDKKTLNYDIDLLTDLNKENFVHVIQFSDITLQLCFNSMGKDGILFFVINDKFKEPSKENINKAKKYIIPDDNILKVVTEIYSIIINELDKL